MQKLNITEKEREIFRKLSKKEQAFIYYYMKEKLFSFADALNENEKSKTIPRWKRISRKNAKGETLKEIAARLGCNRIMLYYRLYAGEDINSPDFERPPMPFSERSHYKKYKAN